MRDDGLRTLGDIDIIHDELGVCLGWWARFKAEQPPDQAPFRPFDPWYRGCDGWAALLDHPDSIATITRSADLASAALRFLEGDDRRCHGPRTPPIDDWSDAPPGSAEAFARLLAARRQALARGGGAPAPPRSVEADLARPRALLLVDWQESLTGGEACYASLGFLDAGDLPGWDTWLALVAHPEVPGRRCLLSWVPAWASALIDESNRIDMAACHSWLCPTTMGLRLVGWGLRWDGSRQWR